MSKILITGSAGFIGSHLVDKYLDLDYEVSAIDRVVSPHKNSNATNYTVDLTTLSDFLYDRLFQDVDVVCHHAAQTDVRYSLEDPHGDMITNIGVTIKLLEASVRAGVKRFIYASSGGAIADSEYPSSPYGIAKLSAEKYLNFYSEHYGIETVVLRYSNVYGPRQSGGVIPIFINKLLKNEPIEINGGEQTRDFIYVNDVAALNALALTLPPGTYTVCSEQQISVNEIADKLKAQCNSESEIIRKPLIKGEVLNSTLQKHPAFNSLQLTSLDDGLTQTIAHFKSTQKS